jgi:calcineurin-like phosphoesterase family protein
MIFFTSDHHFGHANIIKLSNRPFSNVEEMNAELIRRWNEKVGPNDEVYHLGDVGLTTAENLAQILAQLNGKIYLIAGNHEGAALSNRSRFQWIKDYYELKVPDADCANGSQKIMLFHYAMRVWRSDFRRTWHLYGHCHGSLPDKPHKLSFDIGVDCHNFYPLSYEEVKAIMQTKTWANPFGDKAL